jgi:hypothetical protein
MHGAPIQHAAIFEKKAVLFEEGSLDHVRFYANERGSNKGNEGEEGHGKVRTRDPDIPLFELFEVCDCDGGVLG